MAFLNGQITRFFFPVTNEGALDVTTLQTARAQPGAVTTAAKEPIL